MKKALEERIKKVEKSSGNGAAVKMLEVPSGAVVLKFIFFALFRMKSLIHVYKYKKVFYTVNLAPTLQIRQLSSNFCGKLMRTEKYLVCRKKGGSCI